MTTEQYYPSPFKINLGLEVLSKRDDGYHNINSVFYKFFEPHDTLVAHHADSFSFEASDPALPTDDRNLVVRAIRECSRYHGSDLPQLKLKLDKVIPSGAGLGGGSANAATAIRIYSDFVQNLTLSEQITIAVKLGADVPFFVHDIRAMKASGTGEILEPVDLNLPYYCVIVKPRSVHADTAAAYSGLKIIGKKEPTDIVSILKTNNIQLWREKIKNDFEPLLFHLYPELERIKSIFLQGGALFTLMSGSGSAIYGLFGNTTSAESVYQEFKNICPDAFIAMAH